MPHDKQPIFRLKQAFPDITSSEIQFLSKALAQMLALCNEAHLPKTFAPGERWPSNQYDGRLLWAAAALLTMRRAGMPVRAVLEANAYAAEKWGLGEVFYNGGWEGHMEEHLSPATTTLLAIPTDLP